METGFLILGAIILAWALLFLTAGKESYMERYLMLECTEGYCWSRFRIIHACGLILVGGLILSLSFVKPRGPLPVSIAGLVIAALPPATCFSERSSTLRTNVQSSLLTWRAHGKDTLYVAQLFK